MPRNLMRLNSQIRLIRLLLVVIISGALAARGPAQDGAAPAGGGVILQEDTSGHYFEWVLVAIGVGVATYVVCRSSRRN